MDTNVPVEVEFDSSDGLSDEDWDRSLFDRKSNVGKRQIEGILARQAEDRPLSKRNNRKLTFVWGAQSSQRQGQR